MLLSQGTFTPGFDVMPIATPYPACSTACRSADGGAGSREGDGSVEGGSHCLSSLGDSGYWVVRERLVVSWRRWAAATQRRTRGSELGAASTDERLTPSRNQGEGHLPERARSAPGLGSIGG